MSHYAYKNKNRSQSGKGGNDSMDDLIHRPMSNATGIIALSRTDHMVLHGHANCEICGAKATISHNGKPYCMLCYYREHGIPKKQLLIMARKNGRNFLKLKYLQFLFFTPSRIKHLIRYSKKHRIRKKNIKRSKKYELF